MRRVLWLSPYFPPQTRVGALRPLKFVRHLSALGWESVVLCDLRPEDAVQAQLAAMIPDDVHVIRNWSRVAQATERAHLRAGDAVFRQSPAARPGERAAGSVAADHAAAAHAAGAASPGSRASAAKGAANVWAAIGAKLVRGLNPEWLPLGEHLSRMPYAMGAARRALQAFPSSAIVVNADPFAAALVGAQLAAEARLPLIVDLRDPWALCELRRPMRPLLQRALVDRMERRVVEQAATVILNTEVTLDDYRRHYRDLPATRFQCIRNHGDAELVAAGSHPGFDRFTLLFLGNFGRFIKADVLIRVLAELRARGVGPDKVQLVVTGAIPAESLQMARGMDTDAYLRPHDHVPYPQIGAIMAAADLLVLLVQPRGQQRIAAKFFDYLTAERPVLAISESQELASLISASGAGTIHRYADVPGIADAIEAAIAAGRHQVRPRSPIGATSAEAAQALAALLERAVGGG